jgi:ABC-type transport system involved in multi-copper enzyme maturation permease subunit
MGILKLRPESWLAKKVAVLANHEVGVLLAKELSQARRSRGALLTGLLVPIGMLLVAPAQLLFSARHAGPAVLFQISHLELPLFTVICGLVVPSLAAVYIFVGERERRSLELLLALPVRVQDIFLAKLAAAFALSAGVTLPLYAIQSSVVLWQEIDDLRGVVLRFVLLIAALACSLGYALLMALLARDFRTTNNLAGALLLPMIFVTLTLLQVGGVTLFGHTWTIPVALADRPILVAAIMVTVGIAAAAGALRYVTIERYLA